jgi:hypothetical protein
VQQAQKAAPETEAQRARRLRLVDKGRIVQFQLLQGIAKEREVISLHGIDACKNHGLGLAITREGFDVHTLRLGCDGVSHFCLGDLLDARDQITHLSRGQTLDGSGVRSHHPDLIGFGLYPGRQEPDRFSHLEGAVDDPDISHDTAIDVVVGVEHQRSQRTIGIPRRRRDPVDDRLQQLRYPVAGLCRDAVDVRCVAADQTRDLLRIFVGLRGGKVDLVEDGDDLQPCVNR